MKVVELLRLLKEGGVSHLTIGFAGDADMGFSSDTRSFVTEPNGGCADGRIIDPFTANQDPAELVVTQKKAVVPPVVQSKAPEKPIAKAVTEPAGKPTKPVFDQFIDATTKDAGGPEMAQVRADLIGRMSRDDLLRVNVEFSFGIDTDQPDAALRQAILEMF